MYLKKFSSPRILRAKIKAYTLLGALIIALYLPTSRALNFIIADILTISIFFFAPYSRSIEYSGLMVLGVCKDYIGGGVIGLSALQFVVTMAVGHFFLGVLQKKSLITAFTSFILTTIIVAVLHQVLFSFIHKQIIISRLYWKWAVVGVILGYIPLHLLYAKYFQLSEVK